MTVRPRLARATSFSIAGKKARLFDLNNTEILVRAEQVEHYIDKGFTTETLKTATPPAESRSREQEGDAVGSLEEGCC